MKWLLSLVFTMFAFSTAHAGFQGIDQTGKTQGVFDTMECKEGLECSRMKANFQVKVSGIQSIAVSGATDALTSADCGKTFKNSAAAVVTLPAIPAALVGCKITFVVGHASNYDVNPNGTEQILGLTNAAGDAIRNATLGGSVTLIASAVGLWTSLGTVGTWTDVN